MGLFKIRMRFQGLFKELLRLLELPSIAPSLGNLVSRIAVPGIQCQFLFKFLLGAGQILAGCNLTRAGQQSASQTIMEARTAWIKRQHLAVLADRGVIRSLAFVGLGQGLVPPNRRGRHLSELLHRQESEVPIHFSSVVQDFGIVGIEPVQFQRHLHRFAVLPQSGVGALQVQTTHSFHLGLGSPMEASLQPGQGIVVAAQFRQRNSQKVLGSSQAWFKLQSLTQGRHGLAKSSF